MYIHKLKFLAYVMLITLMLVTTSTKASCGQVTIAEMNWASAQLIAHIDKHILAAGFDCNVKLVPGDTIPTVISMAESNGPSIAPEVWGLKTGTYTASPTIASLRIKEFLDTAQRNRLIRGTVQVFSDNVHDGFWIPAQILKRYPTLASIDGVLAHPELFPHPEIANRSAFYGCPVDWDCHTTTTNFYDFYELDNYGFDLIIPNSGTDLATSMSSSNEQGGGWFGYYWEPTALLGKYDMVRVLLSENGYQFENTYHARTYVSSSLFDKRNVMQYLNNRYFPNQIMSQLLSRKKEMQMTASDTVQYFLKNYEFLWTEWMSTYTASIIKSSLK